MLVNFHSLFEHYSRDVYRFALYLSGNPSLAEEIAQETFVRVWIMPGEVRAGTVKAYLLTIARNLYLAEKKRAARQVALENDMPDLKPGPETVAVGRLELDAVFKALQALPETDRSALLMHVQDGLSHAAIASVLGLSTAAVKIRVHRARIKLREMFIPDGE
jgi:RNA polymerase sigma-70 factor (ECF subfamily)